MVRIDEGKGCASVAAPAFASEVRLNPPHASARRAAANFDVGVCSSHTPHRKWQGTVLDSSPWPHLIARRLLLVIAAIVLAFIAGCGTPRKAAKTMEITAYCACSTCTDWQRGRWRYLKLNFWNRYVSEGPDKGKPYTGRTARGNKPREPHPGLLSMNTVTHPWKLPGRLLLPWLWRSRDGTIAADTRYYPFGTRIHVPGYGHGVVEDRGGAIKGPKRLDLYFKSHGNARKWGRQHIEVMIYE